MAILGAYEGLIGLKGESTSELEGLIAESWESNEDLSVWTFKIRPGVTFQDGSPVDAEAVRLNYERFLTLGLGPVNVLQRFVTDPAKITAPDESTVVFDLGVPQPQFPFALASTYGPLIVNAKLMKEHEEDGDWGHIWAQTNAEGTGSGPYKITNFEPGQVLEMERFDDYWRGWDGEHFENVIIRVVTEVDTRRQLLEQGEADIVDDLTTEMFVALEENPDITTLERVRHPQPVLGDGRGRTPGNAGSPPGDELRLAVDGCSGRRLRRPQPAATWAGASRAGWS